MGVTLANFHCTGLSPVQWKVARVTPILHIISASTIDISFYLLYCNEALPKVW